MTRYQAFLFLHISFVIVWIGTGTTLALIGLYAMQARDGDVLARLPRIGEWLGPRVFGPSTLGTLVFGFALVHEGHWGYRLWVDLGLGAVGASFLLGFAVRMQLGKAAMRGSQLAVGVLRRLPVLELTLLYLTVADMVAKPVGSDTGTLATFGAILAVALGFVLVSPQKGRAWESSS